MSGFYQNVFYNVKDPKKEKETEQISVFNTEKVETLIRRYDDGYELPGDHPFLEGNVLLKKPNLIYEYTQKEIEEIKKCKNDIIYFAENYCYIQANDGKVRLINFEGRDYQKRMLREMANNNFVIVLASRQVGKTTLSSIFLMWYNAFQKNKTTLITAHKYSAVTQTLRNLRLLYEKLPFFLKPGLVSNQQTSLYFDTRTRILGESTTKNTGRSYPVNLIYADEFAFVHDSIARDFYTSLYPTLSAAKDGKMIISSTANGMNLFSGLFSGALKKENDFCPIKVDWWEVPGRDHRWKEAQIKNLGSVEAFEQEYGNKFLDDSELLIDFSLHSLFERIKQDFKPNYELLNEDFTSDFKAATIFKKDFNFNKYYETGRKFVISIDFADGVGGDYTVANIFEVIISSENQVKNNLYTVNDEYDLFGLYQVGMFRSNKMDLGNFSRNVKKLVYDVFGAENIMLVVEVNDFRWSLLHREISSHPDYFSDLYLKTKMQQKSKKLEIGVKLNHKNKYLFFNDLKIYTQNKRIKFFEKDTVQEFLNFGLDKRGKYMSQTGHDDIVMTMLNMTAVFNSEQRIYLVSDKINNSNSDLKIGNINNDIEMLLQKYTNKNNKNYIFNEVIRNF